MGKGDGCGCGVYALLAVAFLGVALCATGLASYVLAWGQALLQGLAPVF